MNHAACNLRFPDAGEPEVIVHSVLLQRENKKADCLSRYPIRFSVRENISTYVVILETT